MKDDQIIFIDEETLTPEEEAELLKELTKEMEERI